MARAFIVQKRRTFIRNYIKGFRPVSTKEVFEACVKQGVPSVDDNIKGYNVVAKDIEYLKRKGEVLWSDICYPKERA